MSVAADSSNHLDAVFTASPIDLERVRAITPLGNLNPRGGHVFPTDHVYFDYLRGDGLQVVAPGPGTVFAIRGQLTQDSKIEIRLDENVSYYLSHLFMEPGLHVGSQVRAGQILGQVSGRSRLDLGAWDTRVHLKGFANPARYPRPTLQSVSPLALFKEPVRSQIQAMISREGADKEGKIDFDQPGKLVGNWFHTGLAPEESSRAEESVWSRQLAFVYDVHRPKEVRISIGGTVAPAGVYAVQTAAPDPAAVSAKNGPAKYELSEPRARSGASPGGQPTHALGVLLVELIGESRLKAEYFPGRVCAGVGGFTDAAIIYER